MEGRHLAAGIKINTPGYTLGNLGLNYALSDNGYRLFSVSDTQSANISISKSSGYFISGTISNLTASGLVLQNNGGDNLSVLSGATTFQFSTPVAYGSSYSVTVYQQPTGLNCAVSNGSGTNVMANVTDIIITCDPLAPTISNVNPNIGSTGGGTTVVITGTNLLNTTSVTFGISSATIQPGTTDTAVTVSAPAGTAGAVNVSVTTSGGAITATGAYTYANPGNATSLAATSGNLVFSGSALNWLGDSEGSYKVYYMNLPNTPPTNGQTIPSISVSFVSGKTFIVSSPSFTVVNTSILSGYYMFICDTATNTYTTGNCTNAVARP